MSDGSPRVEQTTQAPGADVALFRHSKRKHWGVAALLWERDGKRGYQFSDGKLRVFKDGFFHLFESAAPPGDGSAKAVRRLARLARAEQLTEATRLPTLRDQIAMFRRQYPDGFATKAWLHKHRGAGANKRLKRHRDPAISAAHSLAEQQLKPLIDSFSWPEIHARVVRVIGDTNLIPAAALRKLESLPPSRELSLALRDWVAGHDDEAELERRFNHLVRLLGPAGNWSTVTAIAGLLDPERHTCVRPSVFEVQAKMLLPNFRASKRPRYAGYAHYLHVAHIVFDELEKAGLRPTDFLDVHDFIWETLRPAARDELTRQYELAPPSLEVANEQAA